VKLLLISKCYHNYIHLNGCFQNINPDLNNSMMEVPNLQIPQISVRANGNAKQW